MPLYQPPSIPGLTITGGIVTINDGSADQDFRVESDDNTHMLFVDAGNDRVGIGTDSPAGTLHVKTSGVNYAALFESDDDGVSAAPDVALYRNSTTPTNGDDLGHLIWRGVATDGAGTPTLTRGNYADIFCEAQVVTTGADSGKMHLRTKKGGTMNKMISLTATEIVVNEDGNSGNQDINFRIESTGNDNMLFVDSAEDRIGIGTGTPAAPLHVVSTDDGETLRLESTDAGAGLAPDLVFKRTSASPATGDNLGNIRFLGTNVNDGGDSSSKVEHEFADIYARANDVTLDTEDGELYFRTFLAGTQRRRLDLSSTSAVFNEDAQDINFRVEGVGAANALFVQGSDGNVGIGTGTPESNLHIAATASGAPILTLDNTAAVSSAVGEPQLIFKRSGATTISGDIGGIVFKGMNDAGTPALFEFGRIFMDMVDETAGSEDGRMIINIAKNGLAASSSTNTEMLRISGPYGFQFNYNKEDHNFEVRGANNDNVLGVDASTDRVGIGTGTPSSILEIQDGLTTTGAVLTLSTKEPTVVDEDVIGQINFRAPLETGADALLLLASISAVANEAFDADQNQTELVLSTASGAAAAERVRVTHDGDVQVAGLTASEILITDANKGLTSAAVGTYPSLAELIHVKGVTSAVQTQLGTKEQVGKKTMWVPAAAMYPSTTNPCSDLTQVETTALRPDLKVLDFDDGADEFAQFTVSFPKSWNEGTVTFQPFWTVSATGTNTVAWELAGISVANDASINTAFGTQVGPAALAHSGTSNDQMVSVESGAVTITGAAVDTITYFQINRNTAADNHASDARLIGVKIFYTTNAVNDA